MRFHDTLAGLLLLIFGGAVVIHAGSFPPAPGQNIGPGLFPILIGCGLAAGGAVLAWSSRRQRATPWIELEHWVRRPRQVLNFALVTGALVFHALAVETVGFFVSAFLILGSLFLAFGVRRRWIAPLAIGVTLALHFAFYTLLRVPLPWGWLEGIAW